MKIDRRIIKLNYRNYEIVARYFQEAYRGRVWRNNKRIIEDDIIEESLEEVVTALYAEVDRLIEERTSARGADKPTVAEYTQALAALKPQVTSEFWWLLNCHAVQGPSNLERLAQLGNYASATELMLDYADFAKKLCDEIGYFPKAGKQVSDANLLILFNVSGDEFNICQHSLILHDEFIEAIKAC